MTHKSIEDLTRHLDTVMSRETEPSIVLDMEGEELGCHNGRLSIIQLGVDRTTYLVDIVRFPATVSMLKKYLESLCLSKYMWDGRRDYSELRHGHGLTMKGLADLQLVYVHTTNPSSNVYHLTSMIDAAESLNALPGKHLSTIRAGNSLL